MRVEFEALAQNDVTVSASAMVISFIQGYFNGGANAWLQLHDAKATPANGAVPLRVWPVYTTAPFEENFQNDPIVVETGCVLVISSTQATLTISASTMDVFVNGEKVENTTGVTVVGDYTTADEVLQVWAQASPGKKLLRLEMSDYVSGSGPAWIQIHAADAPATNKIVKSFPFYGNVVDLSFGEGLDVVKQVGGTLFQGCTIAISTDAVIYAALGANVDYIRATYK
jgi:hypothetical protein